LRGIAAGTRIERQELLGGKSPDGAELSIGSSTPLRLLVEIAVLVED